jgi:hypothetical protein
MKIFNYLTNEKLGSFLILIIPYLGIISMDVLLSPIFNIYYFLIAILSIIVIEIVWYKFLNPIKERILLNAFLSGLIICIFYGEIIIEKSNNLLNKLFFFKIDAPYIYISIVTSILILVFYYLIKKRISSLKYIKTFLLIFGFVMLIHKINQNKNFIIIDNKISIGLDYSRISTKKPIVLIIMDGYVAPDNLYSHYKDSVIYDFSENLKNNNWIVRNKSISEETKTLVSLGSLFNFNITLPNKFDLASTFWGQKLYTSKLYDSLLIHNYTFNNYGIFDIREAKKLSPIYYYPFPISFFGELFDKSMINIKYIHNNKDNLILKQTKHNQWILDSMTNNIKNNNIRSFYYVHLLMPHEPYKFGKEYNIEYRDKTKNYFEFWKFTNTKLTKLLTELIKNQDVRVIITGDHGYDDLSKEIKANNTFTAFYGFDNEDVSKIKTVQDIGFLINKYSR